MAYIMLKLQIRFSVRLGDYIINNGKVGKIALNKDNPNFRDFH